VKRGQPDRMQAGSATGRPAAPKPGRAGPSAEQDSLGRGWKHVVQWGCVIKATVPTIPQPSPTSVTEDPDQRKVSVSKKGGAATNPALKTGRSPGRPK
jgi:hypothetical protein